MAIGMLNIFDLKSRRSHDSLGTCHTGERVILSKWDIEVLGLEPHSTLEDFLLIEDCLLIERVVGVLMESVDV